MFISRAIPSADNIWLGKRDLLLFMDERPRKLTLHQTSHGASRRDLGELHPSTTPNLWLVRMKSLSHRKLRAEVCVSADVNTHQDTLAFAFALAFDTIQSLWLFLILALALWQLNTERLATSGLLILPYTAMESSHWRFPRMRSRWRRARKELDICAVASAFAFHLMYLKEGWTEDTCFGH